MNQEDQYRRARKRVNAKKGFYRHFSVYLVIGIFFFSLNMITDPWDVWWPFPMLSWGVGLAIHYFSVFGFPGTGILSKEWEDREMEKELRRVGYDPDAELLYEDNQEEEVPQEELEDELDLREIRQERQRRGLSEDDFV